MLKSTAKEYFMFKFLFSTRTYAPVDRTSHTQGLHLIATKKKKGKKKDIQLTIKSSFHLPSP